MDRLEYPRISQDLIDLLPEYLLQAEEAYYIRVLHPRDAFGQVVHKSKDGKVTHGGHRGRDSLHAQEHGVGEARGMKRIKGLSVAVCGDYVHRCGLERLV